MQKKINTQMEKINLPNLYASVDDLFRKIDRTYIKRARSIRLIPGYKDRRGGKRSYAEWAYVAGIFQTLIYQNLNQKSQNDILDVGCGTGLLGIASEPFVSENGSYTGIDVMKHDIEFCKSNYPENHFNFIHHNVANKTYAKDQPEGLKGWEVESNSKDLVVALSVWTHLDENDARFYFSEIDRVLKKGGRAIISFFLLDDLYRKSIKNRTSDTGRFNMTTQERWTFDRNAYNSDHWFTTDWVKQPEDAIAVSEEGLQILLKETSLERVNYHPGSWKEIPGIYFQDVLVFEK